MIISMIIWHKVEICMHEEVCSGFNCQKWHDIGEHKSIVLIYVKTINQNSLIYIASVEFEFNAQLRLIIDKMLLNLISRWQLHLKKKKE